jgi:hypothetical protein
LQRLRFAVFVDGDSDEPGVRDLDALNHTEPALRIDPVIHSDLGSAGMRQLGVEAHGIPELHRRLKHELLTAIVNTDPRSACDVIRLLKISPAMLVLDCRGSMCGVA